MSEKEANDHIDEIAQDPTLNSFFDRNPRSLSDKDLRALIEIERQNRALFIEKKATKK